MVIVTGALYLSDRAVPSIPFNLIVFLILHLGESKGIG